MYKFRVITLKTCLLTASLCLLAQPSSAQTDELRLPISLDADSTNYDGKSSMLMFEGLRLSQGNIGVVADEGRATQLDFEDSIWHFSGNVVIDVENGHIESESADLHFSGYQLRTATISGSPATFEMQRPGNEQATYAEASQLVYKLDEGVIEFSGQARITEGGNQISSSYLVYNIVEQRINASSGGEGDPKVRITYTPGSIDEQDQDGDQPADEPPDDQRPDTGAGEENGETG